MVYAVEIPRKKDDWINLSYQNKILPAGDNSEDIKQISNPSC